MRESWMDWTKRMVRPWCDGDSDYGTGYRTIGVRCRGCWLLVEVAWLGVGCWCWDLVLNCLSLELPTLKGLIKKGILATAFCAKRHAGHIKIELTKGSLAPDVLGR
jgi:hypothetical protein